MESVSVRRLQYWLFLVILMAFGALFAFRVWNLRALADENIRERAKATLTSMQAREGWLLSNVVLKEVRGDALLLHYREHRRGDDPKTCYVLTLSSQKLSPCED